jgi:hypothetical protein
VAIHKGDVLRIEDARVLKGHVLLDVATTLQSVTRGVGAYEHQSIEIGEVTLAFSSKGNPDLLISKWVRISDTPPSKLGNTGRRSRSRKYSSVMSVPEVEEALGVPVTRVDLGAKILYKYKDMTVEFQDGKVSDVR